MTPVHENWDIVKTRRFGYLWPFSGLQHLFLASGAISTARDPPVLENWDIVKTRRFGHFWPFSWAIGHSFLAPETISTARDPWYMKIGTSSKHVDLVISGRFWRAIAHIFLLWGRFEQLVTPGT